MTSLPLCLKLSLTACQNQGGLTFLGKTISIVLITRTEITGYWGTYSHKSIPFPLYLKWNSESNESSSLLPAWGWGFSPVWTTLVQGWPGFLSPAVGSDEAACRVADRWAWTGDCFQRWECSCHCHWLPLPRAHSERHSYASWTSRHWKDDH